jgi:2-methylisocitrate lyase-like PEP mutase family enzyme
MTAADLAAELRRLHDAPEPLVLVNVSDVASARVVAGLPGCTTLATASHAIAAAHGYEDGEQIPLELMIDAIARRPCAARSGPVPSAATSRTVCGRSTRRSRRSRRRYGAGDAPGRGDRGAQGQRARGTRGATPAQFASVGVARVSFGPWPHRVALAALADAGGELLAGAPLPASVCPVV